MVKQEHTSNCEACPDLEYTRELTCVKRTTDSKLKYLLDHIQLSTIYSSKKYLLCKILLGYYNLGAIDCNIESIYYICISGTRDKTHCGKLCSIMNYGLEQIIFYQQDKNVHWTCL